MTKQQVQQKTNGCYYHGTVFSTAKMSLKNVACPNLSLFPSLTNPAFGPLRTICNLAQTLRKPLNWFPFGFSPPKSWFCCWSPSWNMDHSSFPLTHAPPNASLTRYPRMCSFWLHVYRCGSDYAWAPRLPSSYLCKAHPVVLWVFLPDCPSFSHLQSFLQLLSGKPLLW